MNGMRDFCDGRQEEGSPHVLLSDYLSDYTFVWRKNVERNRARLLEKISGCDDDIRADADKQREAFDDVPRKNKQIRQQMLLCAVSQIMHSFSILLL